MFTLKPVFEHQLKKEIIQCLQHDEYEIRETNKTCDYPFVTKDAIGVFKTQSYGLVEFRLEATRIEKVK